MKTLTHERRAAPAASGPLGFTLADRLDLSGGGQLENVTVAYETFGTLSPAKDNAILVCHALSGDAHVATGPDGLGGTRPGWWDPMVGPGKAFDTDRYFVICSNVLGGCSGTTGPGSVDPRSKRYFGLEFPLVTIEDMVTVQRALVDRLGIERLLAVTGGSMGGMQALAWGTQHPEGVDAVLAIATTAQLSAQAIAFNEVGRTAILGDPEFREGDYHAIGQPGHGLATARMIGHITYLSDESMREKFGRRLKERADHAFDFVTEFEVESYLAYQGRKFVERFDANTYLYMTKAMDYFDLSSGRASLTDVFAGTLVRYLVLSFSSDWLFPARECRELVDAMQLAGADVTYCEIESPYGHDAFLLEPDAQRALVEPYLANLLRRRRAET